MNNTPKDRCALCGTDDPLFNMWIIVTLQQQGGIAKERICPCCGTHYDGDPRLLQKTPEGIDGEMEAVTENQQFYITC